jgi:hypothetical protein
MYATEQLQNAVDRKNYFYLARCEAKLTISTYYIYHRLDWRHSAAEVFWTRSRDCTVSIARTRLMQRISFCAKRSLDAKYSSRNFEYDDLDQIAIIGEEGEEEGMSRGKSSECARRSISLVQSLN